MSPAAPFEIAICDDRIYATLSDRWGDTDFATDPATAFLRRAGMRQADLDRLIRAAAPGFEGEMTFLVGLEHHAARGAASLALMVEIELDDALFPDAPPLGPTLSDTEAAAWRGALTTLAPGLAAHVRAVTEIGRQHEIATACMFDLAGVTRGSVCALLPLARPTRAGAAAEAIARHAAHSFSLAPASAHTTLEAQGSLTWAYSPDLVMPAALPPSRRAIPQGRLCAAILPPVPETA